MGEVVFWGLSVNAWITLVMVAAVIGVLLMTKVRTDAVFLIAIGVLFATGVLDAREACSGFNSSTVMMYLPFSTFAMMEYSLRLK